MRRLASGLLVTVGLLASVGPLRAQEDSRLVEAVRLAQDGQGDSARAIVSRLLAATPPSDTLFPQVLYTQGLLAKTIDERRRLYQRIAVEYATSSWADDALLRLAMQDYAEGNPAGTAKEVERIRADYPGSPLLAYASYWGARAYFDLRKPADGCRWLADGLASARDNIELKNQLSFYQGRCTALAAQPAETTRADTTKAVPKAAPPPAAGAPGFSVQVGAVKTKSAADHLVADLQTAGFKPHVAEGGGLYRVRVGHFTQRADADGLAAKIKAKMGGSPFVVPES